MSKLNIAYKYRLLPTTKQKEFFLKSFGCCRKLWNLMLSDKKSHYESTGKYLYTLPKSYKEDYPYLKEVDSLALTNVQLDLEKAYKSFFSNPKQFGEPKFKAKHKARASYTTNCQYPTSKNGLKAPTIEFFSNAIKLPKIGRVKIKCHRLPLETYVLKSSTVSMEKDGSFYVSVLFEYEINITAIPKTEAITHIGLDYKSDGLYVDSLGNKADMPHFYKESSKRLAKAQKKLSRMIEANIIGYKTGPKGGRIPIYKKPLNECKNIQKQRQKVARISKHVANQRNDFLHKLSNEIANRYELISIEDINMKALANKGFGNGKATLDNGFGMFRQMLEYKQLIKGHYLIKVDKWFPSSQLCQCGYKNKEAKNLNNKTITCPVCGRTYGRDENAAINIDNEGLKILLAS